MALFTACGDIRDVKFEKNKLKVEVKEEYLYNMLIKEQNFQKIVFYLKQFDDKIDVEFNLIQKKDFSVENLNKMKDLFGSDLIIK